MEKNNPEEHDYPAATNYLMLTHTYNKASAIVNNLKLVDIEGFKAKDIFRASGLSLLGISNSHVKRI